MKPNILNLTVISFLLLFIGTGCKKDEIEIADESIIVDNYPSVAVYKTTNDFFKYISVTVDNEGKLEKYPSYTLASPNIQIDSRGNISYKERWLLKSKYIVDKSAGFEQVFTTISFQEYVDYHTKYGVVMPEELILPRINYKNPYTEFYYMGCHSCKRKEFTLAEINQMIENGTLEEYFDKMK